MKRIILILLACVTVNSIVLAQRYRTWELFKYSGPGLNQIGVLATKTSKEINSSYWSVGCETLDRDYADFSKYKNYVGELGVKRGRLQSGWAKCEKQKGVYEFEWLDECIYGLSEQGVSPWVCLCYGNPIYGTELRLGAKIFTDKKTMAAWLRYVETTVTRYKDVVKEWEVWNEPNGNDSEVYANLLMKTAETIKKIQPDAKVLGLSLAGIPLKWAEEVLDVLKENNKLNLVDYVTYHPYTRNPDDSYPAVEKLSELVHSYNPEIKLFQGENGCPSQLEWGHALSYYPWTEISQAKWFMRRLVGDRVRDIITSAFTIIDLRYTNMLQSFGLLRANLLSDIMYKRPSYYGVQHLTAFFDESVEAVGIMEYNSRAYRDMTVAGFTKENTPVALVWYNDRIPGDDFEWEIVDFTIQGIKFQDPVYVEIISGKVYEIDKTDWEVKGQDSNFKKLPVWDSPMMIVERSEVTLT